MAQPLRCDLHGDVAGVLLVQDLVEGKILVGCPECAPDMVRALAEATGVAEAIADEARDALYAQVAQQHEAKPKPRARKSAAKAAEPQDTPERDESTVAEPQEV